jgi:integrase
LIKHLDNGRWKARVWVNGRGGPRVAKTFDTKKEAQAWERETKRECDRGTYILPKKIPAFRDVAHEWLAGKADKRPGTVAAWQTHLDLHLQPLIGDLRLDRITTATVEKLVRDPLCQTLGPNTVNKVLTTAAAVFKLAVRRGYCIANPLNTVERLGSNHSQELVEGAHLARESSPEIRPDEVLSPSEIGLVLANAISVSTEPC